jgi:hypothetical protein
MSFSVTFSWLWSGVASPMLNKNTQTTEQKMANLLVALVGSIDACGKPVGE